MSKIAFFCIPAYGHTNPTLGVVRELTRRGHEVWYYSFDMFKDKIEAAGATYISCDTFSEQIDLKPEDASKIGKDVGLSIHLLVSSTLSMDAFVCESLSKLKPDCVIADSMAAWGRFAAMKLGLPFISSTTTFAFNRYSAKIMKQSFSQMLSFFKAMPGINRDVKAMQDHDYPVKSMISLIGSDNETATIVYTSKEFQPCADTFSDLYAFVGPSVRPAETAMAKPEGTTVYISLGTVNNKIPRFYRSCLKAFSDGAYHVVMAVGAETDIPALGAIPPNISVERTVDQIAVLQIADVFLSHCGMNSVNESLYDGVPLVLYPQTAEQGGVARRVADLGAGAYLSSDLPEAIRQAVDKVLAQPSYKANAAMIAESFRRAGGASAAADAVERLSARQR